MAAAITGGDATVTGIDAAHLQAVLARLADTGAEIEAGGDRVTLRAAPEPRPVDIVAEPYPGIPTDLQAQWTALMSLARGRSRSWTACFPRVFSTWPN